MKNLKKRCLSCTYNSLFFAIVLFFSTFLVKVYALKTIEAGVETLKDPTNSWKNNFLRMSNVMPILKTIAEYDITELPMHIDSLYLTIKYILKDNTHIKARIHSTQHYPVATTPTVTPDKKILKFIRKKLPDTLSHYINYKESLLNGFKSLDLSDLTENIINRVYLCNDKILFDCKKKTLNAADSIIDHLHIHHPYVAKESSSQTTKRVNIPYCDNGKYLRGILLEKFPRVYSAIFFERSGVGHYLGFTHDKKTFYNVTFSSEYALALRNGVYVNESCYRSLKLKIISIDSNKSAEYSDEIVTNLKNHLLLDLKTLPAMTHLLFYSYELIDLPENIAENSDSVEPNSDEFKSNPGSSSFINRTSYLPPNPLAITTSTSQSLSADTDNQKLDVDNTHIPIQKLLNIVSSPLRYSIISIEKPVVMYSISQKPSKLLKGKSTAQTFFDNTAHSTLMIDTLMFPPRTEHIVHKQFLKFYSDSSHLLRTFKQLFKNIKSESDYINNPRLKLAETNKKEYYLSNLKNTLCYQQKLIYNLRPQSIKRIDILFRNTLQLILQSEKEHSQLWHLVSKRIENSIAQYYREIVTLYK